jgi:hypothetical protein
MMIAALYELTEKHGEFTAQDIALFTDQQLLEAFDNGNAFTKDVAKRIHFRQLYEPLPFRLNLSRDLDETTQQKVLDLAKPKTKDEYAQRLRQATEAAKALMLSTDQKVIFDFEPVPVTSVDAYTEPCLYDDIMNTELSLFDVLGHLRHAHGVMEFGIEKIDMHRRYIRETTEVQFAVPFEIISGFLDELQAIAQDKHGPKTDRRTPPPRGKASKRAGQDDALQFRLFSVVQATRDAAYEIVSIKLTPLFDAFMNILGMTDGDQRNTLMNRFNADMTHYLLRSVRPQLVLSIPSLGAVLDQELTRIYEDTGLPNQV